MKRAKTIAAAPIPPPQAQKKSPADAGLFSAGMSGYKKKTKRTLHPAAGDIHHMRRDVLRLVGGEIQRHVGNVDGLAEVLDHAVGFAA